MFCPTLFYIIVGLRIFPAQYQSRIIVPNSLIVHAHKSEGSKSSTHHLGDKNRFDVSSKGPSSGISVGGSGKARVFLYK